MMMLRTIFKALILIAFCANAAVAAYPPEPNYMGLDKGTPTKDGGKVVHYVVVKPTKLLTKPEQGANYLALNEKDQPQFLDTVVHYGNEGEYALIQSLDNKKVFGWIAKEFLLTETKPKEFSQKDPCYMKVVPKNNWERHGGLGVKKLSIYAGPGHIDADNMYGEVTTVNLFTVYYAYKVLEDAKGKKYVLVGEKETVDPRNPTKSLVGWMDWDFLTVWPNRIGLSYDLKNAHKIDGRVEYFDQRTDLERYLQTGDASKSQWGDDLSKVMPPKPYDLRSPAIAYGKDKMSIKIAYVGNTTEQGNLASGASERMGYNPGYKIRKAMGTVQKKDILFVIDATSSMQKYFGAVKEGITSYFRKLDLDEKANFRFGVAVYRDYPDGNKCFEFPIKLSSDVNTVAKELNKIVAKSHPADKTLDEAVFNGVIKAVDGADWREGISRSVVVIGDHCNDENDARGLVARDVANSLDSGQTPVAFYSINVNKKEKDISKNRKFMKQSKDILGYRGGHGALYDIDAKADDYRDAVIKVRAALKEISNFSFEVVKAIDDTSKGASYKEIKAKYGEVVANYLLRMVGGDRVRWRNGICRTLRIFAKLVGPASMPILSQRKGDQPSSCPGF